MNHYKEAQGFKVGDSVYRLNHYTVESVQILDIFDDYYSDDEDFICKWVKVNGGFEHLSDVFKNKDDAEWRIKEKKNAYDHWATTRY